MYEIFEKIMALNLLPALGLATLPYYVINIAIIFVVFQALRMIIILLINKGLSLKNQRWSSDVVKTKRFLILGDSTAVGTGAKLPEETIAGRLAKDFPNVQIINLGQNGGLIKDLTNQINDIIDQKFDMIIISAGGNDVWHLTKKTTILKHLEFVLEATKVMSNNRVLFLIYNNIGDAPLFPRIIRYFLKKRCDDVQRTISLICYQKGVSTIDLFSKSEDNPFIDNYKKLFALDGIHPSGKGYGLWYKRMWRTMVKNGLRS